MAAKQESEPHTAGVSNTGRRFVGSLLILPAQLINLYDERDNDGCVRLVSTVPMNHTEQNATMIWHNLVKAGDLTSPVTMSNVPVRSAGTSVLTFAIGLRVFLVKFRKMEGRPLVEVGSISSLKIADAEPGSRIASISAHFALTEEDGVDYLLAFHPRPEIRGYSVAGEEMRPIPDVGSVLQSSIAGVASNENTYAIVSPDQDDVILIKSVRSIVRRCGTLRPSVRGISLRAVSVIWTGSMWMVLGVHQEDARWAVLVYGKAGEVLKICEEGSYIGDILPMCVTRFGNTGLVSFADGTNRSFIF